MVLTRLYLPPRKCWKNLLRLPSLTWLCLKPQHMILLPPIIPILILFTHKHIRHITIRHPPQLTNLSLTIVDHGRFVLLLLSLSIVKLNNIVVQRQTVTFLLEHLYFYYHHYHSYNTSPSFSYPGFLLLLSLPIEKRKQIVTQRMFLSHGRKWLYLHLNTPS